jgi:pyruvate,water dikinase
MAAFVGDLEHVAPDEVALAGDKAATLGALKRAGIPVPDGFVIEAPAYRGFVADTELDRHIANRLAGLDATDEAACRQAAADIFVGVVATPMPRPTAAAIVDAYDELSAGGPPAAVAVRSSVSTPDTGSHMLAHANATFLYVRGAEAVLDAVGHCWASLHSDRALLLRHELGLPNHDLDIAVLVQHQISATRAGVLITGAADPTAERSDIVVEASYGLGEGPSTGVVQPDRYLIDKPSLNVVVREIGRKESVVHEAPGDGGTWTQPVAGEQVSSCALQDDELRMLARLGMRIEDRLGAPQVVEWAIDRSGGAWILQSTPLCVGSTTHP